VLAVLRSPPRWWRWRGLGVEPHRSAGQYRLIRLRVSSLMRSPRHRPHLYDWVAFKCRGNITRSGEVFCIFVRATNHWHASIGTNHQNLVAKQQDMFGLILLIERKNFVIKYSRISGAWFFVPRSIVCGVVVRSPWRPRTFSDHPWVTTGNSFWYPPAKAVGRITGTKKSTERGYAIKREAAMSALMQAIRPLSETCQ